MKIEGPVSPVDAIMSRLDQQLSTEERPPVMLGSIDGKYTLGELDAFEKKLLQDKRIKSATLGRTGTYLSYVIDTRTDDEAGLERFAD